MYALGCRGHQQPGHHRRKGGRRQQTGHRPAWLGGFPAKLRHGPESTQIDIASTAMAMAARLTLRLREVPVARALTTRAASAGP